MVVPTTVPTAARRLIMSLISGAYTRRFGVLNWSGEMPLPRAAIWASDRFVFQKAISATWPLSNSTLAPVTGAAKTVGIGVVAAVGAAEAVLAWETPLSHVVMFVPS